MAIIIPRESGLKILLRDTNAAPYPAEVATPLNVDVFYQYKGDANQSPQYLGTVPVGQEVTIPFASDLDRDIIITTVARGPAGQRHEPDLRDAPSMVVESEREQRKPVIGQVGASTSMRAIIGVSYFPRHMRARRVTIAADAGFTTILSTVYEDVDRVGAETPRLPEYFEIRRAVPGFVALDCYVKVAHAAESTSISPAATDQLKLEGLRWGPESDPLFVTIADAAGVGGSTGIFNPFTATIAAYGPGTGAVVMSVPQPEGAGVSGFGGALEVAFFNPAGSIVRGDPSFSFDPILKEIEVSGYSYNTTHNKDVAGPGSPEGAVTAVIGSTWRNTTDGGFWKKVSGSGDTGWEEITPGAKYYYHAITDGGVTPDPGTDTVDTTATMVAAIAAANAAKRIFYLPSGTYRVSGLTLPNDFVMIGDGKLQTIIKSTGANAPVLDCPATNRLRLRDLSIYGTSAGTSQSGIKVSSTSVANIEITSVFIQNTGSRSLWLDSPTNAIFSSVIDDVETKNWNMAATAGVPSIDIDTDGPCIVVRNCYLHDTSSANPIGYRVRRNATRATLFENCNGIDPSAADSVWCIVGQHVDFGDAVTSVAFVTFLNCNIEAFETAGIEFRGTGSFADFLGGNNFTAGADGCIPIWFRSATNPYTSMGQMSGLTTFANGDTAATTYLNDEAIQSEGCPPLILTGPPGTFGTYSGAINYFDSSTSTVEPIRRMDAYNSVTKTGNYAVVSEGVAVINSESGGSARTITLLWAGRVRPGQVVIVADASGDAKTNPLTINAAIGTVGGIGARTIYNNRGAMAFYANGDDWTRFGEAETPGQDWDNANQAVVGHARYWTGTTGSAGFPAIALNTDPDTGLFWSATNTLAVTVGGQLRAEFGNWLSIYAYGASTGETGAIRLFDSDNSASVTLRAPDAATAHILTLPANNAAGALTNNGSGVLSWTAGTAPPFDDATAIIKGSADASKLLRIEVDGFTTATTRVLTPQNADYTIAGTDLAQSFTGTQTFNTAIAMASGALPISGQNWSMTGGASPILAMDDGTVAGRFQLLTGSYLQIGTTTNHITKFLHNGNAIFQIQSAAIAPEATNAVALGDDTHRWSEAFTYVRADIGKGSAQTGEILLRNATNNNTLTLKPGVTGSNLTFTLPTADVTNGYLKSNGSGVLSFDALTQSDIAVPYCEVAATAAQSVLDSTLTYLAFASEVADTDSMHDNATNNSRITIPVTGKYSFTATVPWDSMNATQFRLLIRIYKNRTDVLAHVDLIMPSATQQPVLNCSGMASLTAGDYVEVAVFHNFGTTKDTLSAAGITPLFSVVRVA